MKLDTLHIWRFVGPIYADMPIIAYGYPCCPMLARQREWFIQHSSGLSDGMAAHYPLDDTGHTWRLKMEKLEVCGKGVSSHLLVVVDFSGVGEGIADFDCFARQLSVFNLLFFFETSWKGKATWASTDSIVPHRLV